MREEELWGGGGTEKKGRKERDVDREGGRDRKAADVE